MQKAVMYDELTPEKRREVRNQYVKDQKGLCFWCNRNLNSSPVMDREITWSLFPNGRDFLRHPVHLQHDHVTGLTEGAVHAYCNAVMWEYYGR